MKTTERFDRAIKALVSAFFDATLAKSNCAACAVGNIVGEAIGTPKDDIVKSMDCNTDYMSENIEWANVFCSSDGYQMIRSEKYMGDAKKQIDATGYLWRQLAKVEEAFEGNTIIRCRHYHRYTKQEIMADQFNGLMAVVDVLCEIEGYDPEPYKKMFEYTEEFKPVNV